MLGGADPVYSYYSQHFCTSEFLMKIIYCHLCTRNANKLVHKDMIQVSNLENRESRSSSDVDVRLFSVFRLDSNIMQQDIKSHLAPGNYTARTKQFF